MPLVGLWQMSGGEGKRETPAGSINGVNTVFTISENPWPAESLHLTLNGQSLAESLDYSRSGLTLTLARPPHTGSTLIAAYRWDATH